MTRHRRAALSEHAQLLITHCWEGRYGRCLWCGGPWRGERFCSQPCEREARAEARAFLLDEMVAEQDGLCGICGEPLDVIPSHPQMPAPWDPDMERTERWSAEVDHIHPVAEGGNDDWWNLRAVHRRCNRSRPRVGHQYGAVKSSL